MFPFPDTSLVCIYREWLRKAFCSLELRVQFCLLVCCTYLSLSTVNKERNRTDQRASLQVDTEKHNKEEKRRNRRKRLLYSTVIHILKEHTSVARPLFPQVEPSAWQMRNKEEIFSSVKGHLGSTLQMSLFIHSVHVTLVGLSGLAGPPPRPHPLSPSPVFTLPLSLCV